MWHVKRTRDHQSAIGGITRQGKMFLPMHARASHCEDVVRFFQMLLHASQCAAGPVGWLSHSSGGRDHTVSRPFNGHTCPRGARPWLRSGVESRRELGWNVLTRCERNNRWCRDLAHLGQELVRAKERLRHRPGMLQHCFPHALVEVSLFLTRSVTLFPVLLQREALPISRWRDRLSRYLDVVAVPSGGSPA